MIVTVTLNPSLDEWVYLPRLRLGELNRAVRFARYAGGKGINVSRVIHELKGRTVALALAGGSDGRILSGLLARHRIPHHFVTVPGSTRNNYEIHTDIPRATTQINCPGPRASVKALVRLQQVLQRVSPRAFCLVFSGSLPPGLSPTTYQRMITGVRSRRVLTVLDTSGPALRRGLAARPWLIKPNRRELEELLGHRLSRTSQVAQAARQLAERGPTHVLVSLGPEGAMLASHAVPQVLWAIPPRVRVDSAVGAGDSLVAGFVLGWRRTRSLRDALRLGVACGTSAAMTPGTELCRWKDVKRLAPRIVIRAL